MATTKEELIAKIEALRDETQNGSITASRMGVLLWELEKYIDEVSITDAERTKLAGIEEGAQVNAQNTVVDASYVHTDNNYTSDEKAKLAGILQTIVTTIKEQILDYNVEADKFVLSLYHVSESSECLVDEVEIPMVNSTYPGLMSASDKTRLDSMELGAEVNSKLSLDDILHSDKIVLQLKNKNDIINTLFIPAATTEAAGAMSAADKVKLENKVDNDASIAEVIVSLNESRVDLLFYPTDESGGNLICDTNIPAATNTTAGVMSAHDKACLESMKTFLKNIGWVEPS